MRAEQTIEARNLNGYLKLIFDCFIDPKIYYPDKNVLEERQKYFQHIKGHPEEVVMLADAVDQALETMRRLKGRGERMTNQEFLALQLRYTLTDPSTKQRSYKEVGALLPKLDFRRKETGETGITPQATQETLYVARAKILRYSTNNPIFQFTARRDYYVRSAKNP